MIKNTRCISHYFRSIAKGNRVTLGILKQLADTARLIDPDCPHGAKGVLDDLEKTGLTPMEINQLYKHCNKNPLYMNAVIYGAYSNLIDKSDLKKSILTGKIMSLKEIEKHIRKGIKRNCQSDIQPNHRFGQYYNQKIK